MCESKAQGGRRCLDGERYRRMTAEELAPAPREGVEDVAWAHPAGPHGDTITRAWAYRPDAACCAMQILEEARQDEPATTADVMEVARELGGTCHGLAYRVKSPDSLARKLEAGFELAEANSPAGFDKEELARAKSDDANRYTIRVPDHDALPARLETMVQQLRHRGWEPVEIKDSYLDGNTYKGLHLIARAPSGRTVEVQIHSKASIGVKDVIHADYEVARDKNSSRAAARAAKARCVEASRAIPTPSGLARFYPPAGPTGGSARGAVAGVKIRKKAYT